MSSSPIYKTPALYEVVMLMLYGRNYSGRYQSLADLIPAGSSVLDLCCGPAVLYDRYLRQKSVRYTGLDLSGQFIDHLRRRGGEGQVWDARSPAPLPLADFVVMQASLYHFLPDPRPVVERMLQAARRQIIIAEPVRNLANSRYRLVAACASRFTDAGGGPADTRFTPQTLDTFFASFGSRLRRSFHIPGGREKVFILDPTG
jgi:SAM-dependent methyltransferase